MAETKRTTAKKPAAARPGPDRQPLTPAAKAALAGQAFTPEEIASIDDVVRRRGREWVRRALAEM